jgi:hypothetical protein
MENVFFALAGFVVGVVGLSVVALCCASARADRASEEDQ